MGTHGNIGTAPKKVIDRIAALLRLANNNTNEAEATLAAQRAQELMFAHQLSANDLEAPEEDPIVRQDCDLPGKQAASWRLNLWNGLCITNRCQAIILTIHSVSKRQKLVSVGRAADTQTVRYLYEYLARYVDRKVKRECQGRGRRFANAFRLGFVDRVIQRLKESLHDARVEATLAGKGDALVRLDQDKLAVTEHFKSLFPRTRPVTIGRARDYQGYQSGLAEGSKVALQPTSGKLRGPAKQIGQ